MINTLNTWLHGDERGFRSRNSEIESSGDYKHRPPPEEYRKLREYFRAGKVRLFMSSQVPERLRQPSHLVKRHPAELRDVSTEGWNDRVSESETRCFP